MIVKIDDIENIKQLMPIWLETNIAAHNFISREYWKSNYNLVESLLPSADIFIYTDDNIIKGFIGILNNSYIAGLFVASTYQSLGIGKELLEHCKKLYDHLELDVYTKNIKATQFYKNNGFAILEKSLDKNTNEFELHMIYNSKA